MNLTPEQFGILDMGRRRGVARGLERAADMIQGRDEKVKRPETLEEAAALFRREARFVRAMTRTIEGAEGGAR